MHIISVIFWGSTLLSIAVSIAGCIRRKGWMLAVGALLACPLCFYLGATPRFKYWGALLPVFQIVAANVVRRSPALAAALLIPFLSITIWTAVAVLSQF